GQPRFGQGEAVPQAVGVHWRRVGRGVERVGAAGTLAGGGRAGEPAGRRGQVGDGHGLGVRRAGRAVLVVDPGVYGERPVVRERRGERVGGRGGVVVGGQPGLREGEAVPQAAGVHRRRVGCGVERVGAAGTFARGGRPGEPAGRRRQVGDGHGLGVHRTDPAVLVVHA